MWVAVGLLVGLALIYLVLRGVETAGDVAEYRRLKSRIDSGQASPWAKRGNQYVASAPDSLAAIVGPIAALLALAGFVAILLLA